MTWQVGQIAVPEEGAVRWVTIQARLTRASLEAPLRFGHGLDRWHVTGLFRLLQRAGLTDERAMEIDVVDDGHRVRWAGRLGIALAMASAILNKPIRSDLVAMAEVGLLGDIRNTSRTKAYVERAAQDGVRLVLLSPGADVEWDGTIEIARPHTLREAVEIAIGTA